MTTDPDIETMEPEPEPNSEPRRGHRRVGLALVVVASVLTFFAIYTTEKANVLAATSPSG